MRNADSKYTILYIDAYIKFYTIHIYVVTTYVER